jgi:glycosyltransferase involved in cell wall biosynthesis
MAGIDWWYSSHAHSELQLLRRVALTRRVLFVNSIGLRMPMPGKSTQPWRRVTRKIASVLRFLSRPIPDRRNFIVLSPVVLPLYGSAAGRVVAGMLVRTQLRLTFLALGIRRPIFVVTLPTGYEVIEPLARRALVVNKADKFSALHDVDQDYIAGLERTLLAEADRVVYVSRALMDDDHDAVGDRGVFLDHGVDLEHFTRSAAADLPADLMAIPGPRIGYFGSIDDYRVDFDLLERVARAFPEAQLVLVGDATCSLERFDELDNVHWLGERPYEEIPGYGSGFDVGLMPYLRNEFIRNSNPIKVREYLALGLPVVSTEVPEMHRYDQWVLIADDHDEFVDAVGRCLRGEAPSDPAGRRAAVAGQSWDVRADEFIAIAESGQG